MSEFKEKIKGKKLITIQYIKGIISTLDNKLVLYANYRQLLLVVKRIATKIMEISINKKLMFRMIAIHY